jgi:hypothetical protein
LPNTDSSQHENKPKPVQRALRLAFCFNQMQAAPVSTNESGFKLTGELRDDSRVVGKSLDDKFKFHSSLLGDLKLNVNDAPAISLRKS